MRSSSEILAALTRVANQAFVLAVVWHVVIAIAVIAIVANWRPSQRVARALLAAPLLSACAVAFADANWFNMVVMGVLATGLLISAMDAPPVDAQPGPMWAAPIGGAMIAFAWVYPHFLRDHSPWAYLYGSPVGLVPCPTLALVIGFALLGGGLGTRVWSFILAAAGLFYGIFGVARLGVLLDIGLLAGSLALFALAFAPRQLPHVLRGPHPR
jgi:hypothetical protein